MAERKRLAGPVENDPHDGLSGDGHRDWGADWGPDLHDLLHGVLRMDVPGVLHHGPQPDPGPDRGPDPGAVRGPDRGADRGPDRGAVRGPDRGPDRGAEFGPVRSERVSEVPHGLLHPGWDAGLDQEWGWAHQDGGGWVPPPVDTSRPSVARMYDYCLDGTDNYPADREAAERLLARYPGLRAGARANRAFLIDTVAAMADAGIHQFLDLGPGIPTSPGVHEIARGVHPGATVVYVDTDPGVLAHGRTLLAGDPGAVMVARDPRYPQDLLADPRVHQVLDLGRPVGVLLLAVLHVIDRSEVPGLVVRYAAALAPGSRIAISAYCCDGEAVDPPAPPRPAGAVLDVADPWWRAAETPETVVDPRGEAGGAQAGARIVVHTRGQAEQLFGGLTLLPPGLVEVYGSASGRVLGGVARVPAGS